MEEHDSLMRSYPPSLAAAKKMGAVPDGFAFYAWRLLGKPGKWKGMSVRGAVFREAVSGPNKGRRTITVPGTERTVLVTQQEIADAEPIRRRLSR